MIKIKQFVFSYFQVNTYLFIDKETRKAAVIDPAMSDDNEKREFDDYVRDNDIKITQVINTHMHLDHCFGLSYVRDQYGVPVKSHQADTLLVDMMDEQFLMFGMQPKGDKIIVDVYLKDGDVIEIGKSSLEVIHLPGHSEGGIGLYCRDGKLLFSGDTVFRGSVGRTDLPGGNHGTLIKSIRNRLFTLPDDVKVLPGHGPMTTIGDEKRSNPFV